MFSSTGFAHAVLGLLGCIPGPAGAVFDLVDAAIYAFVDHDYGMAALSLLSAVAGSAPIAAGKFMKIAESSSDILTASKYAKMARGARYVETGANLVNNTVNFARNGSMAVQNASAMYKKHENGQDITAGDWLSLGMNVLGCAISGGQMAGNTLKLGRMLKDDGVGARLKAEMSSFANNPKCYIQGGNKCFVAGTKIKTIDGYKNIEDIEEGDLVYAQSEETGETGYKEVVTLFRNEATELTHVQIGDNTIITTPTHPFWVEGYGFKAAGELKAGDLVQTAEGDLLTVTGIEKEYLDEPITVYNFEVADWHTYYVSEDEVLVHNMCVVGNKGSKTTGPYADLKDSKSVGEGKRFTSLQKKNIIQKNMEKNGGIIKSDLSGEVLVPATQSQKGVTPNPLEVQIDHIKPRSKGGSNSYSNAQVLSRRENINKSDK